MVMVELSNERVDQILHEETHKTEELITILRGVYIRFFRDGFGTHSESTKEIKDGLADLLFGEA